MATPQQYVYGQQPGPQAQQTPLHPTVSYGQPGGEQATVLPPQQTAWQQGMRHYREAGYSPDNLPPAPQPPQPPPPQYMPQQQQGQQGQQGSPQQSQQSQQYGGAQQGYLQQAQPQQQEVPGLQIDPNTIIDGPGVPPELKGRRWGQVMQIYSALAEDWTRRQSYQRTGGSVPAGGQMPQQDSPAPQPQPQPQQQARDPQDWREEIRGIVQDVVSPVITNTQAQSVRQAKELARMAIPDFAELESDIMQMLGRVDPQGLIDPQVWESAADLARGRRFRNTQVGNGQFQQPQYGPGRMNAAMPYQVPTGPGVAVPAGQYPINQYQFFTEGPSAPMATGGSGMISPAERSYAQKMGMSDQEYIAWRGGVVR